MRTEVLLHVRPWWTLQNQLSRCCPRRRHWRGCPPAPRSSCTRWCTSWWTGASSSPRWGTSSWSPRALFLPYLVFIFPPNIFVYCVFVFLFVCLCLCDCVCVFVFHLTSSSRTPSLRASWSANSLSSSIFSEEKLFSVIKKTTFLPKNLFCNKKNLCWKHLFWLWTSQHHSSCLKSFYVESSGEAKIN